MVGERRRGAWNGVQRVTAVPDASTASGRYGTGNPLERIANAGHIGFAGSGLLDVNPPRLGGGWTALHIARQRMELLMEMVELPLVPEEMPLGETFMFLKDQRKSGLVVEHPWELVLLQTSDLTRAWNVSVNRKFDPRKRPVGSIPPLRSQTHLPNDLRVNLEEVPPYAEISLDLRKRLEHVFDEPALDDRHVVFRATRTTARVFASSKAFTAPLGRSSVTCFCAGPDPDVHSFTKDQVNVAGQCNYAHKAKLTCDDDY